MNTPSNPAGVVVTITPEMATQMGLAAARGEAVTLPLATPVRSEHPLRDREGGVLITDEMVKRAQSELNRRGFGLMSDTVDAVLRAALSPSEPGDET